MSIREKLFVPSITLLTVVVVSFIVLWSAGSFCEESGSLCQSKVENYSAYILFFSASLFSIIDLSYLLTFRKFRIVLLLFGAFFVPLGVVFILSAGSSCGYLECDDIESRLWVLSIIFVSFMSLLTLKSIRRRYEK